jgi:hypothetical protein
MNLIKRPNKLQLVIQRKIRSSPAYSFSKSVRNFFVQNKLGKTEVEYFRKSLKYLGNEESALFRLKRFIQLPPTERERILHDEFEMAQQMSFRLGESGKKRPLRTQPKKKRN